MSLLNEVLKDLEKRETSSQKPHVSMAPSTEFQDSQSQKNITMPMLAVIMLASIGYWIFSQFDKKPSVQQSSPTPVLSTPVPVVQPQTSAPEVQTANKDNETLPSQPVETPAIEQPIKSSQTLFDSDIPDSTVHAKTKTPEPTNPKPVEKPEPNVKPDTVKTHPKTVPPVTVQSDSAPPKQTAARTISPAQPAIPFDQIQQLIQYAQLNKAGELIDQLLLTHTQNEQLKLLRSQIWLKQKQPQKALDMLHSLTQTQPDEYFLSLEAAAFQQKGDHSNALYRYQTLTVLAPNKAEYWLGLGIASERQQQTEQALEAYREALSKSTLAPAVVNYIQNRIKILTR